MMKNAPSRQRRTLTIAAVKMSREGKVVAHLVFSRETNFGQHLALLTARLVINAYISKR